MKMNGSARIAAPLPQVWDALRDPAILVRTIPGCRVLETTGADTYKMTVTAGVASIRGTYVGQVALTEPEPPHAFVLRARGQGSPGTVDATVRVRLSERDGGTHVDYAADAIVGGMIGGVGQRMLGTVARRTAGEFFAAVEQALNGPAVAPVTGPEVTPEVAPATGPEVTAEVGPATRSGAALAAAPAVYAAPERPGRSEPPLVAAFGAGGAVALGGVIIGYLIGRRSS